MSTSNYCSLQHLFSGLDIDAAEHKDLHLSGLQQDSRKVKPGNCFIAVTGLETDGRRFIDKAIKAGAVAVLQEADGECHGAISSRQGVPVVSIKALLHKMSRIAANFYAEPSTALSVVGNKC
ncbi:MAG: Mur ligase domain-containing protein [Cellvibrionaceae bacterium]|nr:Mur ligase domain-containing protein [Cellvibrionaceae bacterium]